MRLPLITELGDKLNTFYQLLPLNHEKLAAFFQFEFFTMSNLSAPFIQLD